MCVLFLFLGSEILLRNTRNVFLDAGSIRCSICLFQVGVTRTQKGNLVYGIFVDHLVRSRHIDQRVMRTEHAFIQSRRGNSSVVRSRTATYFIATDQELLGPDKIHMNKKILLVCIYFLFFFLLFCFL